jgi:hypothetical protein
MRNAPTRLGPMLKLALQRAHEDGCDPQPCVVAVTPVAFQQPAKTPRLVGTPTWRDVGRATAILELEGGALDDARAHFQDWLEAKNALVGALRSVGSAEGRRASPTFDGCCGNTGRGDAREAGDADGPILSLKRAWRAAKDHEIAFDGAWARIRSMNAELLDLLTLQAADLSEIFSHCECHGHEKVCDDSQRAQHDEPDGSGIYEMKALFVADNAETAAEEADEAAARADSAAHAATAAAEAVAQAQNATARRNARSRSEAASVEAEIAARLARKAAEKADRSARRAHDVAGEARGIGAEAASGTARSRVESARGEAEGAADLARQAASRARREAEAAEAAGAAARQVAEGDAGESSEAS